jgi:hypothetical protein
MGKKQNIRSEKWDGLLLFRLEKCIFAAKIRLKNAEKKN